MQACKNRTSALLYYSLPIHDMNTTQFKKGDWLYDIKEQDYFLYCSDLGDDYIDLLHVGYDIIENYSYGVKNTPGRFIIVDKEQVPQEYIESACQYAMYFA